MKTIITLVAIVAFLPSCGTNPLNGPNPLFFPGKGDPTAEELHTGNLRAITGNPCY